MDGSRAIITVNTKTYPVRQRFSIAHELGHWITDCGRGGFLCATEDIGPQNAEAQTVEALANSFASQLILPDYLFGPKAEGKPIARCG
ncbi:MAG: ImmA/IrrE family metallo-endopeptidase [Gammaproteobacteria bacterium]